MLLLWFNAHLLPVGVKIEHEQGLASRVRPLLEQPHGHFGKFFTLRLTVRSFAATAADWLVPPNVNLFRQQHKEQQTNRGREKKAEKRNEKRKQRAVQTQKLVPHRFV